MIERVAKAMMGHMFAPHELPTRMADAELFGKYCSTAREAIAAMREPTKEMLFVGSNDEAGFTARNLQQSWYLMIDEALN